jgi:hypothetical protein
MVTNNRHKWEVMWTNILDGVSSHVFYGERVYGLRQRKGIMARKAKTKAAAVPEEKNGMIDHTRYEVFKYTGDDGKTHYSRGNGDAIAVALRGMSIDDQHQVARDNDMSEMLDNVYANHGQFRMALGVKLRAIVRKGEKMAGSGEKVPGDYWPRIGGRVIRSLTPAVAPVASPRKTGGRKKAAAANNAAA